MNFYNFKINLKRNFPITLIILKHIYEPIVFFKQNFVITVWSKIKEKKEVERFKADVEVCSKSSRSSFLSKPYNFALLFVRLRNRCRRNLKIPPVMSSTGESLMILSVKDFYKLSFTHNLYFL